MIYKKKIINFNNWEEYTDDIVDIMYNFFNQEKKNKFFGSTIIKIDKNSWYKISNYLNNVHWFVSHKNVKNFPINVDIPIYLFLFGNITNKIYISYNIKHDDHCNVYDLT